MTDMQRQWTEKKSTNKTKQNAKGNEVFSRAHSVERDIGAFRVHTGVKCPLILSLTISESVCLCMCVCVCVWLCVTEGERDTLGVV